jgi:nicotinamidase-related amidase
LRIDNGRLAATMVKRIIPEQCCGVIVDVQSFFLAQLDKRQRSRIESNTGHLARLLGHFEIPVVVTLEQPLTRKGLLPQSVARCLGHGVKTFEKNTFDLCKERRIRRHLTRLKRTQFIVAGCETDVCVLQSCLGLLALGHEVYLVEETLFSSSRNVVAAIERMETAGAVFVSYKTLFYELVESVDGCTVKEGGRSVFRPFPADIPDSAVS